MTLCDYCRLADNGCPIYPRETVSCSGFKPVQDDLRNAELALKLAEAARGPDSYPAWKTLCELLVAIR